MYQFQVLAFGLGPAPRIFTKLMKVPISILRKSGIKIIIYLDDMLIIGSSLEEILKARDTTLFLLEALGFTINQPKSSLTPSHKCEFLGMIIDSLMMVIALPSEKALNLMSQCQKFYQMRTVTLRDLSKIIGKLYATAPAVSVAPMQTRALQQVLIQAQHQKLPYEELVTISKEGLEELTWWKVNLQVANHRAINIDPPRITIETDASKIAWGAHLIGGAQ